MICLDANYLIRSGVAGSTQADSLMKWCEAGEGLITSSIAWYEFLCGPVLQEQIKIVRSFLTGGIVDFSPMVASEAARLFNLTGRRRQLRVDTMIAAAAIVEGAALATFKKKDFKVFEPFGLTLV